MNQPAALTSETRTLSQRASEVPFTRPLEERDEVIYRRVERVSRSLPDRIRASLSGSSLNGQTVMESVIVIFMEVYVHTKPHKLVIPVVAWPDVRDYRQSGQEAGRKTVWNGAPVVQRFPWKRAADVRPTSVVLSEFPDPTRLRPAHI